MNSTFPVFDPASPQAAAIRDLFVQVLLISAGIFLIVAGLICLALWRFRDAGELPRQDFGSHRKEIAWMVGPVIIVIWIAAISAKLMLTINAAPPMYASAEAVAGDDNSEVALVVTGHQWWWEVEYPGAGVVSANEIHIPVGRKRRVKLESADVIHSFWVPQLARKMDAIPGHSNYVWLEASRAGVYQGRCAEYCGTQHAWMNFKVIAHPPDEYEQWLARKKNAPAAPADDDELAQAGKTQFMTLTCSQCHKIDQTEAQATYAPDLTHLASRRELGAGVIENSPENLRRWLRDPQALKPGCKMPNFKLSDDELDQLVAYLETLQ